MSLRFPVALVLSIVCLAAPAWADFKAGVDAYHRGDHWPSREMSSPSSNLACGMRKFGGCPRAMSMHSSGMKKWPYDICVNEN